MQWYCIHKDTWSTEHGPLRYCNTPLINVNDSHPNFLITAENQHRAASKLLLFKGEGDPTNVLTAVLLDIQFFCDVKLCQWVSNTQCVTGLWCLPSYTMNLQTFRKHTPNDTASHAATNESSETDPFQSLFWVLWQKNIKI
jgi:hypothetical protein